MLTLKDPTTGKEVFKMSDSGHEYKPCKICGNFTDSKSKLYIERSICPECYAKEDDNE